MWRGFTLLRDLLALVVLCEAVARVTHSSVAGTLISILVVSPFLLRAGESAEKLGQDGARVVLDRLERLTGMR